MFGSMSFDNVKNMNSNLNFISCGSLAQNDFSPVIEHKEFEIYDLKHQSIL